MSKKKEPVVSKAKSYATVRKLGLLIDGRGEAFKSTLKELGIKFQVFPMRDSEGLHGEIIKVEPFTFVIEK